MIGAIFVQIGGEMKKILVTGFDPFGGEKVNPALEVIKLLPKKFQQYIKNQQKKQKRKLKVINLIMFFLQDKLEVGQVFQQKELQ